MQKYEDYFTVVVGMFHDRKILPMRTRFGLEGYGFWVFLISILRQESDFGIEYSESIFDDLKDISVCKLDVKEFIDYCISKKLLFKQDSKIYSKRLLSDMSRLEQKIVIGRESANKRWQKNATATPTEKESAKIVSCLTESIKFFNQHFSMISSGVIYDMEEFIAQGMTDAFIVLTLQEALDNGARTWKYAKVILANCVKDKVFTKDEFMKRKPKPKADKKKTEIAGSDLRKGYSAEDMEGLIQCLGCDNAKKDCTCKRGD